MPSIPPNCSTVCRGGGDAFRRSQIQPRHVRDGFGRSERRGFVATSFAACLIHVRDHQMRAFAREQQGDFAPDAAATANDQQRSCG